MRAAERRSPTQTPEHRSFTELYRGHSQNAIGEDPHLPRERPRVSNTRRLLSLLATSLAQCGLSMLRFEHATPDRVARQFGHVAHPELVKDARAESVGRVAVVVNADLASELEDLVGCCSVWAVRTTDTEQVARRVWDARARVGLGVREGALTLFRSGRMPRRSADSRGRSPRAVRPTARATRQLVSQEHLLAQPHTPRRGVSQRQPTMRPRPCRRGPASSRRKPARHLLVLGPTRLAANQTDENEHGSHVHDQQRHDLHASHHSANCTPTQRKHRQSVNGRTEPELGISQRRSHAPTSSTTGTYPHRRRGECCERAAETPAP